MPWDVTVYTEYVEVRPLPQTSDQNKSKVVSGEESQQSISDANGITVYHQPTSPDRVVSMHVRSAQGEKIFNSSKQHNRKAATKKMVLSTTISTSTQNGHQRKTH
jgi:hypothetical protein